MILELSLQTSFVTSPIFKQKISQTVYIPVRPDNQKTASMTFLCPTRQLTMLNFTILNFEKYIRKLLLWFENPNRT